MNKRRSLAVTGAAGLVGRSLCDHFRRLGWDVRAFVRQTSKYPFSEPGVRLFECDLPDRIDPAGLEGADALVHAAYVTRFVDRASAERVNDLGTRRILEVGRANGIPKFLFISSQAAHEYAESYYGKSKFALEKLFGERDVIVRPGLVIGHEGNGLFHRMRSMVQRSRLIPLFGGGRQPIQTVHVEDFSRAVEAALVQDLAGLFTIAHPRSLEMAGLLRGMAARLGARPRFVPFPIAPVLLLLRVSEALRVPLPISSENLLGLKCLRATDTSRDLATLGITLRDTLASLDDVLGRMPIGVQ